MLQTTLCYLERDDHYLMLHRIKKEEDVNAGKWIGVGGKFERNEAPEDCLIREVYEETGLILKGFHFRGILTFIYDEKEPEYIFTYTADEFVPAYELMDHRFSEEELEMMSEGLPEVRIARAIMAAGESGAVSTEEIPMNEGVLKWVPKAEIEQLELWEGDRYLLRKLFEESDKPFSLKLIYDKNDALIEAYELSDGIRKLK